MTQEEITRQEVNKAIAEANREINLGFNNVVPEPEPRYFEVIKESVNDMPFYGNTGQFPVGTLFKCTQSIDSMVAEVSHWLRPAHLPLSGFKLIAFECCKELSFSEYEIKLDIQEKLK